MIMKKFKQFCNLSFYQAITLQTEELKKGNYFLLKGNKREGYYLLPKGIPFGSRMSELIAKPK